MKTDNRSNGNRFEHEMSHILAKNGFWVHVLQQNKSGQPADLIAIRGRYHTLIDCKVISDDRGFPLKRIEDNQRFAMTAFCRKSGEMCYFAMRLPDKSIWMVSLTALLKAETKGEKRLSEEAIRSAYSLERWMKETKLWGEES